MSKMFEFWGYVFGIPNSTVHEGKYVDLITQLFVNTLIQYLICR